MSYASLLNDRCLIQNRTVNTDAMADEETWKDQPMETKCRAIKQVSRRRSSPASAEKVQYGTYIFTNFILPKAAEIAIHDRISYRDRVYDVLEVIEGRDSRGPHHLVAICDVRA